jgi:cytochrome c556
MEAALSRLFPKSLLILTGVFAGVLYGSAFAQNPADAVKSRQANFKAMGKDFKSVSDQLKTASPDFVAIKKATGEIRAYSVQLPSWFPKGSGPETGLKMQAKAAVWTDPQAFATAAKNYQVEAAQLAALSSTSTDVAALVVQFKATGKTCGACHNKFREKD